MGVQNDHLEQLITSLKPVVDDLDAVMGNWDGDFDGAEQEASDLAAEIIEKINEVLSLIRELG